MILPRPDGTCVLAYRVAAVVGQTLPVIFVNARTGAVEMRYNNMQSQQKATALAGQRRPRQPEARDERLQESELRAPGDLGTWRRT